MSDWPALFLVLFLVAVGSAVGAAIALPFVYRRGQAQIDEACVRAFGDRDAATNVRILADYEGLRNAERFRRQSGGAS